MHYFVLHKPRATVCAKVNPSPELDRMTVWDVTEKLGLPMCGLVGRLDFETSGLMIFSSDGPLNRAIARGK